MDKNEIQNQNQPAEEKPTENVKETKFRKFLNARYEKRALAGKPLTPYQKLMKRQEEKRMREDAETDPVKIKKIKRKREIFQVIKYFTFAASAGAIQISTYSLFLEVFKWGPWLSYLISLILSVLWNFTFNRKFTFKSAGNIPIAMLKVAGYYAVFTPLSTFWTGALTTGVHLGAINITGKGIHPWAIEIPTLLINGITEFLYQKFFVFNDKKSKKPSKTEVAEDNTSEDIASE